VAPNFLSRIGVACMLGAALLGVPHAGRADEGSHWLMASPYSIHFEPSPEHRHVWLLGYERREPSDKIYGVALFSNSFGQPSTYIYPWGQTIMGPLRLRDTTVLPDKWFLKWSAGLLYGYKGAYKDKVPLNHKGFSPGVIVSLGREFDQTMQVQMNLLGANGLMFQFNVAVK
jgi:hypothetical protein